MAINSQLMGTQPISSIFSCWARAGHSSRVAPFFRGGLCHLARMGGALMAEPPFLEADPLEF